MPDGTAEPVSRHQFSGGNGDRNIHFPCTADHEQDFKLYSADPYSAISDDHTSVMSSILSSINRLV